MEHKKKDLRFVILFLLLVSCSLLYLFQSSYAKYRRSVSGRVTGDIAQWNIKVNEEDIMNKKTLSSTVEAVFPESEYNKEGVVAPGIEGYYLIQIDASQVDVPFECHISSTVADESSIRDLKTTSYSINPGAEEEILTYSSDTGIVKEIARNTKQVVFKIYVVWDDVDGQMDNQEDTTVGVNTNSKASMNVVLRFSQINH